MPLQRRWIVAALAVAGILGVSTAGTGAQRRSVAEALDLYARGEYARAVDAKPFDGFEVVTAIAALEAWIGPADVKAQTPEQRAGRARRQQVAARFAIDVTAARELTWMTFGTPMFDGRVLGNAFLINPDPGGPSGPASPAFDHLNFNAPIVAWACDQLPHAGPVEPWEPWWWLASIALLQGAGEWNALQGSRGITYGPSATTPPRWRLAVREEVAHGHLKEARARIGAHPRLRLAEVVTRAASLTDALQRFNISHGGRRPFVDGRHDVIRHLEAAARTMNSGPFNDVERDLEALLTEPGMEGEVALRIGQLRMLRRDWATALRWLDRASGATSDRIHLAAADYFRGWIFHRTDRPADALAAYKAAHARYDTSPNLNTLLAAELMAAGQRLEAARVLERAMRDQHNHAWKDLWMLVVDGDAQRAGHYARQMREAR